MGFRFRKKIKIAPGVSLNLGKKGINSLSASFGWFTSNFNSKGAKHTLGAHGTGLSYETKRSKYSLEDIPLLVTSVFWTFLLVLVILLGFF